MKVISSLGPKIELLPYPLTKLPKRATGYTRAPNRAISRVYHDR